MIPTSEILDEIKRHFNGSTSPIEITDLVHMVRWAESRGPRMFYVAFFWQSMNFKTEPPTPGRHYLHAYNTLVEAQGMAPDNPYIDCIKRWEAEEVLANQEKFDQGNLKELGLI